MNWIDPDGRDYVPGGGWWHGNDPEAWLGDGPEGLRGGSPDTKRWYDDADYVKVNGEWHKIRGPVYIDGKGRIWGWDEPAKKGDLKEWKDKFPKLFHPPPEGNGEEGGNMGNDDPCP